MDCLLPYAQPLIGMLRVTATFDISILKVRAQAYEGADHISNNPILAYDNYCRDLQIDSYYKCTYEEYITQIIDKLIVRHDLDFNCEASRSGQKANYDKFLHTQKPHIVDNDRSYIASEHKNNDLTNEVVKKAPTDFNYPNKKFGYLAQVATDFSFVGPDREPVEISSIDTLLKVADCILSTGVPNYQSAKIPIKSGLNVEAWENYLQDYLDKKVLQYIKFGYPLSLLNPHELCNKEISNHYSAWQYPSQVQEYIIKEKKLGAILGPIQDIDHNQFHCSPLLTQPKDVNQRQVILNLSHPNGQSVNDHVDKNEFDHSPFILKFPSIDSIVQDICDTERDVVLFKVDVAHTFHNLRVDLANALKFGIK